MAVRLIKLQCCKLKLAMQTKCPGPEMKCPPSCGLASDPLQSTIYKSKPFPNKAAIGRTSHGVMDPLLTLKPTASDVGLEPGSKTSACPRSLVERLCCCYLVWPPLCVFGGELRAVATALVAERVPIPGGSLDFTFLAVAELCGAFTFNHGVSG